MEQTPDIPDPAILVLNVCHRPTSHLGAALADQGFRTWNCRSRGELSRVFKSRRWSLVLIDLPYPDGGGLESCARVRELFAGPVAVVSTVADERDQLRVLAAGADDFIAWPIGPDLLGARLRTLLRRAGPSKGEAAAPLTTGDLEIDPARREVRRAGRRIEMTGLEFDLLVLLASHVGSPVSRESLHRDLRGLSFDGLNRSIDLRISRLRRKLGDDARPPRLILTVRGTGYQLAAASL